MAWLKENWNYPDRTDHYLMQIAAEINRVGYGVKNPSAIQIKHKKLNFDSGRPKPIKETVAQAQSRWIAGVGGNVVRRTKSGE